MEKWAFIPGYCNYYKASTSGRIKAIGRLELRESIYGLKHPAEIRMRILKQLPNNSGYLQVPVFNGDRNVTALVHRLVALAWLKNRHNKKQVNHKNGNKKDNRVCNLEWVSVQENFAHAKKRGLTCHGIRHGMRKLNPTKVRAIRRMLKTGKYSYATIGKRFNVDGSVIGDIRYGRIWRRVT